MSYNLPHCECKRCGHKWVPREEKKPIVCPKCKSPYWDRALYKKKGGEINGNKREYK